MRTALVILGGGAIIGVVAVTPKLIEAVQDFKELDQSSVCNWLNRMECEKENPGASRRAFLAAVEYIYSAKQGIMHPPNSTFIGTHVDRRDH